MIGKFVVIDTLDNFKSKLDSIPSSAIVLIKDVGQIYAHGTYFGGLGGTSSLLDQTNAGLAPKGGISPDGLISNAESEWVLTVTEGKKPSWRKLPSAAFSNAAFSLEAASKDALGGIKVGKVYDGVFSTLSGKHYTVDIDRNGLAYVSVPWEKETYTLPTASNTTLGGVKTGEAITDTTDYTAISIKDGVLYYKDTNSNSWRGIYVGGSSKVSTSTSSKAINFKAGSNISISHLAAGTSSGQSGSASYSTIEIANTYSYTLPTASSTLGGVKTTSTVTSTSGYTACPIIDGIVYYKNTTYSAKAMTINGTAYNVYTSANSLPTLYAPTALGSAGQVLKMNNDGTGLVWGTDEKNTNTWRPVKLTSDSGDTNVATDTSTTLKFKAGSNITLSASSGVITVATKTDTITATNFSGTASSATKWGGYKISVTSSPGTDTSTIYFVT